MDLGQVYTYLNANNNVLKAIGGVFAVVLFLNGYIQHLLVNTCIFGYLIFCTMKFLKNVDNLENCDQMIELLKYWTCFSVLITVEYFFSLVFGGLLMTFLYSALKVVGLVLLLQDNQLLIMIYDIVLCPIYNKYEQQMQQLFTVLEDRANNFREVTDNKETDFSLYNYVMPYFIALSTFGNPSKKTE